MTHRTISPEILAAAERLKHAGGQVYLVGGAVRDMVRGVPAGDVDLATDLPPDAVRKAFPFSVATGIAHGTVTVWLNPRGEGKGIEVTTFRKEGTYSDGRRPDEVVFVSDIKEDLARRDFTINAMALEPFTQALVDPFGGARDLEARVIRAVGDPVARFNEDGLRAMRAVRFSSTLEFAVAPETAAAIAGALPIVARVSPERVRDELLKLLGAPRPSRGLLLMQETGLLGLIFPELAEGVGFKQNHHHKYDVWLHTLAAVDAAEGLIVRLAALLHDVAKPRTAESKPDAPGEHSFHRHDVVGAELSDAILRRLRCSNEERERVAHLVRHHLFWYEPVWSDGTVRRFVRRIGEQHLVDLFALRRADVIARGFGEDPATEIAPLEDRIASVLASSRALHVRDLAIDGADVMRVLGLPPSKQIGDVLEALVEEVLEDPELNERSRLLERLALRRP